MDYALHPRWIAKGGLWRYTAREETFIGTDEKAFAQGAYASLYGSLHEHPGGGGKLAGFTRVGIANGDVQQIAGYLGLGLVYSGFGEPTTNAQFGLATATAFSGSESRALKADKHGTSVEMTFSANLTPWLRLQPNLQYVINPGFDPTLKNSLVVGLRMEITGALDL